MCVKVAAIVTVVTENENFVNICRISPNGKKICHCYFPIAFSN